MSAKPARHLELVEIDHETGEFKRVDSRELAELQAKLEKVTGDFKNAEKDLAGKRRIITQLQADQARERLEHPQRDLIRGILKYWHQKCRPADWNGRRRIVSDSPDRFDAVAALVEMERIVRDESVKGKRRREWVYEREHFVAAVQGAAFDPFTPKHKNGKPNPQNNALQVFGTVDKFDLWIEKCPYEVVPILPARVRPGELAIQGVTRNDPSQVPTTLARSMGEQACSEGSYGIVGVAPRGVPVRIQAGQLLVRGRLGAGVAGEPAA